MKKILATATSMPFMAFLLLTLALAMAAATFIEASYGTPAARALVYRAWWFELLWALFALNLVNNIFRFRLYKRNKLTLGIFHAAFLLILAGAVVTRYISYEGKMHIREGEKTNLILSSENYFYAGFGGESKCRRVFFSKLAPGQFSSSFKTGNSRIRIKSAGFISQAERRPVASETGNPMIDFVYSSPDTPGMQFFCFEKGYSFSNYGISAGYEAGDNFLIRFFSRGSTLFMVSDAEIGEMAMSAGGEAVFAGGDTIEVKEKHLYRAGEFRFLIRNFFEKARLDVVESNSGETGESAVLVRIDDGSQEEIVPVFGYSGVAGDTVRIEVAGGVLKLVYGAVPRKIPCSLFLKDFRLENYPGSESPSSYSSDVTLSDPRNGFSKDFRIFMNNTLSYGGFKFFQSSYDSDQKGTILSVSHDFWGTAITYIGYFFMIVGFILSLLNPHSYFRQIVKRLGKYHSSAVLLTLLLVSGSTNPSYSQGGRNNSTIPDIDKQVVAAFGKLWVQGHDGRIEPVSTLSGELVRKISHKSSFPGKSPDEILLGFMAFPDAWQTVPIIKISGKIGSVLGFAGSYVSLSQIFDSQGNYLIAEKVKEAYNKPVNFRNQYDKEYINIDEKVNICFMIIHGSLLNIYPAALADEPWHVPGSLTQKLPANDSILVDDGVGRLVRAIAGNNKNQALQALADIGSFQTKYGSSLLPSDFRKEVEIGFNKINPFKRLFPLYLLSGFLLLVLLFVSIFRQKTIPVVWGNAFYILFFFLFAVHSAGLAARWVIAGHAPLSNGYESIVYVAWAVVLAGLFFGRKHPIIAGTAVFLAGIALFVAHLSWMNPEVTNLVPVLKSYWLTIHVAVVTSSYGFIGLSAFLGILVLILLLLKNNTNSGRITAIASQVTLINEMSLTLGLYFLATGMFLGGIWANESWGRYWGWDPKETWAMITVMVYAFIAHMRLIPSLRGIFIFNTASVLGFSSVLMTYFGVNYYMSGMHSYGKGVADGTPWAVIISAVLIVALIIASGLKHQKQEAKIGQEELPDNE